MGFLTFQIATHGVRTKSPKRWGFRKKVLQRMGSETFRTNRLQTCFMYVREVRSDYSKPSPHHHDPCRALPFYRSAPRAARLKKASLPVREGGARESQQPIVRMGRKLSAASDLAARRAIFAVKPLLRILRSPPQHSACYNMQTSMIINQA